VGSDESVKNIDELHKMSFLLRRQILDMVYKAKTGHIGGDFSVTDILTALYFGEMNISPEHIADENRDRFILSKGHAVEAYYAVLSAKGFLNMDDIMARYSRTGSPYTGHPCNLLPGIEMNSGSLGHGLSVSAGMALAGKRKGKTYRVYTVMGDGECAEGSVWEAAMAAGHYHLDNLCAVLDRNRLQISGTTETVMAHENMAERFETFGWHTVTVDGHDFSKLLAAFKEARQFRGKPTLIVAETIKGYGVSFMENQPSWHHQVPTKEAYEAAVAELEMRGNQESR